MGVELPVVVATAGANGAPSGAPAPAAVARRAQEQQDDPSGKAKATKAGKAQGRKPGCKTWPFSWYGTWSEFNPHRKLDVIVVVFIMAVYAFAVAGIIGQGQRNAEKTEF